MYEKSYTNLKCRDYDKGHFNSKNGFYFYWGNYIIIFNFRIDTVIMTKKQLIKLWDRLDDDAEIEFPYASYKENGKIKKIIILTE